MTERTYCPCWPGDVTLHDGHCCFAPGGPDRCHYDEGYAAWVAAGSQPIRVGGISREEAKS